jgi:DNA-binding MarR family transcriptional regulator
MVQKPLIEKKPPTTTREELTKEVRQTLTLGGFKDEYSRSYEVSKGLYHVLKDVPGEKEKFLNNLKLGMKKSEMSFIKEGDHYYIKITAVPKVSVKQLKEMKLIKTKPEESKFAKKLEEYIKLTPEQRKAVEKAVSEAFSKELKVIKLTPKQRKEIDEAVGKALKAGLEKATKEKKKK